MNWFQLIREDFSVVFARDPAVRSRWAVLTLHSGFRAVVHRPALAGALAVVVVALDDGGGDSSGGARRAPFFY